MKVSDSKNTMLDYKEKAAGHAFRLIIPGQTVGLGNGRTVLFLADLIASEPQIAASLTLATSSAKTMTPLLESSLMCYRFSNLSR